MTTQLTTDRPVRPLARRLLASAFVAVLAGVAGFPLTGHGQTPSPPVGVTLAQQAAWTVAPADIALQPGETRRFTAPGSQSAPVSWQTTGGSIGPDGVFTAPATPGTYVVQARLPGAPLQAQATVRVVAQQGASTDPADRFVDSLGINIRLHNNGTFYRENWELTRQRLVELGIRHYRDNLVDTTWQGFYERHATLARDGMRGVFVLTKPQMPAAVLQDYPRRVGGALEAYEAVNEYDNSGDATWPETLRAALAELRKLKDIPAVAGYPIYGPSMGTTSRMSMLGDSSDAFDFGNLHNYFGGRHPGTAGYGVSDKDYPSYGWQFRKARPFFGNRSVVTTETGYATEPATQDAVPSDVAGKYMPRLLLEQYRQGISRTYIHALADDWQYFGLVTKDGTPKPAYRAVQGLIALLSEPGASFAPTPLRYAVQGGDTAVRHIAFQKSNGRYFLALWIESLGYDVNARQAIAVPPQRVTIALDGARPVALHVWTADGSVQHVAAPGIAPFTVTDTLQVIELQRN